MSELDLDRLEALPTAASPGPWRTDPSERVETRPPNTYDVWRPFVGCVAENLTFADAEFIAAAREAVPALIAEVRRLAAKVDAVKALHRERFQFCRECDFDWPCPTIRALEAKP